MRQDRHLMSCTLSCAVQAGYHRRGIVQSTCPLLLRLATAPLALAILGGGDREAGSGGHHQPIATCPVPMRTSTFWR